MRCKSCGSEWLANFNGECAIHFSGLKNIDEPVVWVFPKLLICLNCGATEFAVPEDQLRLLAKSRAAGAG
jgi:hypothetical protein